MVSNDNEGKTYEQALMALADVFDEFDDFRSQYGERHGALLLVAGLYGVKPSQVKADMAASLGE